MTIYHGLHVSFHSERVAQFISRISMLSFRILGWQEMVLLEIILTFQPELLELKVMLHQSMLLQV